MAHRANQTSFKKGSSNVNWKGNDVGYHAVHAWIARTLGTPTLCQNCGMSNPGRVYHWANKDGRYRRNTSDWTRLCVSCHRKYDMTDEWKKNLSLSHARVDAEKVREMYSTGRYSRKELGVLFECSSSNIGSIINKETHRYASR